MSADSTGAAGQPQYATGGAPDTANDLSTLANLTTAWGWPMFATLAALNAWTPSQAGQHATVTSDPTAVNIGDYVWSGSAWVAMSTSTSFGGNLNGVAFTVYLVRTGHMAHLYGSVVNGGTNAPGWGATTTLITLPTGWAADHTEYFYDPKLLFLLAVTGNTVQSAASQTWAANTRLTFDKTYQLAA